MSALRRARDALERMAQKPTVHFVSKADRAEIAREQGKMEKGLPPHLAAAIKKIEVDGVEIKAFDLVHPDGTGWETDETMRKGRRTSK